MRLPQTFPCMCCTRLLEQGVACLLPRRAIDVMACWDCMSELDAKKTSGLSSGLHALVPGFFSVGHDSGAGAGGPPHPRWPNSREQRRLHDVPNGNTRRMHMQSALYKHTIFFSGTRLCIGGCVRGAEGVAMVSTRSGGRAPATEVGSDEGAGITPSESFLDQLVHGVVAELAKEQSASGALDRSGSGSAAGASDLPELDSLYWKPEVRLSGIPRPGDPSTSAPSGASLAKQVRRVAGSKCVEWCVCV